MATKQKTSKKQAARNARGQLQKGHTANPNGRPKKGYSITEMMKEMLASQPEIKEAMGKTIVEKALQGDITAIKLVWQYMDGMPLQTVENITPQDDPVKSLMEALVDASAQTRDTVRDAARSRKKPKGTPSRKGDDPVSGVLPAGVSDESLPVPDADSASVSA